MAKEMPMSEYIGLILTLFSLFSSTLVILEAFGVTRDGYLMGGAFFGSFGSHYVWLYYYALRGVNSGGPIYRWPNLPEAVWLVLNASITVVSFLEIVRRAFGLRIQFMAPWAAVECLIYAGVVVAGHKAYMDATRNAAKKKKRADPEQETTQLVITTQD